MTEEEKIVLVTLGAAWDQFLLLDVLHTNDRQEFSAAIHAAQNIVLARAGLRALRMPVERPFADSRQT